MNIVLAIGIIFLCALVAEKLMARFYIPAVTSYLLLGIVLGPYALDIVGDVLLSVVTPFFHIALGIIAFHIGINFSRESFSRIGKTVVFISLAEAFASWLCVALGLHFLAGLSLSVALVFGAIAAATAPAAIMMVVMQYKAKGFFSDVLLGIVALDDAWGIIVFSLSLAVAVGLSSGELEFLTNSGVFFVILGAFLHILISVILGATGAFLVSRAGFYFKERGGRLVLVLGMILFNSGLSLLLGASPLLSNILLGAVLINIDKTAFRYFDAIKAVDWPLYIVFYVLAGASLNIELLASLGAVAVVYLVFRCLGKIGGAYLGALAVGADVKVKKYMGLALIPQAGVALGLALMARESFPEVGDVIFTTIAATTIIYELFGPVLTRYALRKAGNINEGTDTVS